jgi:predicted type IV restriction endonuclease
MANIPKKVVERFSKTISKFQRILKTAKGRDINEADTVSIVGDMLSEVFGFDKYVEVTSEFSIKGTYCDLAIKIDGKIQYLLEVKAIGLDLKEHHLRQAVNYGATQGVQWVILTNGVLWEIYRIRFEKPLNYDLVSSFDFLELNPRKADVREKLFLLCKEGLTKAVREDFYERVQSVNRFVIGAIVLSDGVVNVIKRELKKISSGLKIENTEIEAILQNEVLKRDVIEGELASKAKNRVKKVTSKSARKPKVKKSLPIKPSPVNTVSSPEESTDGT